MPASRFFPCRVCGQSTEGVDSYVVCGDCANRFERQMREPPGNAPGAGGSATGGPETLRASPDEVERQLRRLLDDW